MPVLGAPLVDDVLEPDARRMTVARDVGDVVAVPLLVHLPSVPVALFGDALRAPVGPHAELRVAEPVGSLVLRERGPGGLELKRARTEEVRAAAQLGQPEAGH